MYTFPSPRFLTGALAIAAFAVSASSVAQITNGNGAGQSDSRAAPMGPQPDVDRPAVHESNQPQSRDATGKNRGNKSGGKKNSNGAGGFNNGLYGTGAGSSK